MNYKKIYIIGPPGGGKTTLSSILSKKHNIECYELDKVVWDDDNNNTKRTDEEISKIFESILKTNRWIIEDVGRSKFERGREQADIIYYIKISRLKAYYRVIKRWIRQRTGQEKYNAPPTIKQFFYFIKIVNSFYNKQKQLLQSLEKYQYKLKVIYPKDIKIIIGISN